ncbi:choice-of-anchor L domain-containing protein [Flavobacterium sp.]|uniref:choice-of-anchor L domain-containing protein n=1 Tax=Flavobacterium sp. TaxID=239 RepID=UPI0039E28B62
MKKNFLLILMGFLSFSGFAQLDEDFESAPAAPDGSGVWTMTSGNWLVKDNRVNAAPNWEINPQGTYPANGGVKAAFVNRENTGPGVLAEEWLITPLVNVTDVNRQLRFFTRQTLTGDDGNAVYQIRVSTDANQGNLGAYEVLVTYTETQLSTITPTQLDYEEKIINLTGMSGNRYFAFVKVCTQPNAQTVGDRWLIDDVHIVERCLEPDTFGVTNVSAYNATLTWEGNAANYTIEYGPSGFLPGSGTIVTGIPDGGNTDSYTIPLQSGPPGPLTPDTAYQFYVTSVCSTSSSLQTGPFNFITSPLGSTCEGPIEVTPLPYSDTGDTLQQGNNVDETTPGSNCGTTGEYLAGNDVVYSYTVPDTTTGLISIEMNPLGNTNTGVFVYASCDDIGNNCIAGVANSNGGVRSIPALPVTAGSTIYIVVSSTMATPSFTYNILIQNVTCAPPTGLSATGTGPNSANLSWQNPGNATQWEVFVQTAGSPVPTTAGIQADTNVNFGVTELTAEGTTLQLGTPYQYWVRALCPDGVSFSQWAGPYLFNTTSCSSGCNYTFELVDAFGDGWNGNTISVIQDGLAIAVLGPTFTDGEGPVTVSVPLCDGPFTLFWNEGGDFPGEVGLSVINSFGQVIFVKEFGDFSQNSEIFAGTVDCQNPLCLPPTEVTWSTPTTNGVIVAWVPNGPAPVTWEIYALQAGDPVPDAGTTPTVTGIPGTDNTFTLTTQLDPDTEYTIYVRAVCSGPGENPWSEPSEPFTTLPTCPRPTNIQTTAADLTSLSFTWTAGGTETAWEYAIVLDGDPVPTTWLPVGTNSVTINTDLTQGTAYDFYVRAVCIPGEDISVPAGPHSANTTVCPASEQCNYTFTLTDSFGDGWNGNTMSILQNGIVVATIGADFVDGAGPIEVQVPLCHGVAFELFWNNEGNFPGEVGVSVTSFLGATIYNKPFNTGEPGTTLYSGTGECVAPTCLVPTGVLVTSTSLTTATITWDENNPTPSGSWDILIQSSTLPPPIQSAPGWINVDQNPYTYGPLDPATSYTVYVRSVCSETDKSFWSIGADFGTQICLPANVCDYTFTMTDSFGDGWNGNTMTILQNGIPVAVIGNEFTGGTGPIEVVIPLCNNIPFSVFWNNGGNFAGEVGMSIENASGDPVFTLEPGSFDLQGTTIFEGEVNCVPATCPRPVQLNALEITETSAQLSWTEAGTATSWEVIVLPAGSTAPANTPPPYPGAILTTDNPVTVALESGTAYVFYVRALCSDSDISNWGGPKAFNTLITNDECDEAIHVPVNGDQSCAEFASGTIIGATPSALPTDCGGTADDDVWFEFTAVTTAHNINLTNVAGSTEDLFHVLYQGDECGNMTQIYCSDDNQSIATGLTPGGHYFIRVYSWTDTPNQTSTFNICIGTIPPPITSNTETYTPVQLIEDVLINSTCANISNITYSTGTNFGSVNGIGYFEKNGSSFPFDYGIVLTSGNADLAPGPNTNIMSEGIPEWPGDPDLAQVLTDQGITGITGNATTLEFDFVPLTDSISFDFIFASEEYGTFQCQYSDVFAFLLTNLSTNETTNLAVLPSTDIPVSVTTIRNGLYNENCESANEEYFAAYYLDPGLNPLEAPINYNGVTVPLTAYSQVTPGQAYHIKLAIADFGPFFQDNALDSAVFLKGGSFGIGDIELGDNLLEETGNAVCSGQTVVINSTLDPADYTFVWLDGEQVIDGANGATLTVDHEGTYTVQAHLNNSTCMGTDSVIVEYYSPVQPTQAPDLVLCDSDMNGVETFDLTVNEPVILGALGGNYTLTYFNTLADAQSNNLDADIETPTTYTGTNGETIYVRVTLNPVGCFEVTTFDLILTNPNIVPVFNAIGNICSGDAPPVLPGTDNNGITGSWSPSFIDNTLSGVYVFTPDLGQCAVPYSVNVTVLPAGQVPLFAAIGPICVGETFVLPTQSTNGINGSWTPAVNNTQTTTYTFEPAPGQCAVNTTITVVVNQPIDPGFEPVGPLCEDSPPLTLPTTSDATGITGTWNPAVVSTDTVGTSSYVFTPNAGQCANGQTLSVTVIGQPAFTLASGCVGLEYVLTVTPGTNLGNDVTYTWTDAQGDPIPGADEASFVVTTTGTYGLTVTSGQCSYSQDILVTTISCTIQRGISPGDGSDNDFFDLAGLNVRRLEIFNRYGTKVYSKTNYSREWYGQSDNGNELPDGTYFYVIERDGVENTTGWIYINRVK